MGHGGDGKTSLVESLLNISGATDRVGKIADGNTVCDFDPEEIRRKFSISTAVAPVEWNDCKINLLDTPGFFDFESEVQLRDARCRVRSDRRDRQVRPGRRHGKGVGALRGAGQCRACSTSRKSTRKTRITIPLCTSCRSSSAYRSAPIVVPIFEGNRDTVGIVDCVIRKAYRMDGNKRVEIPIPEDMKDRVDQHRAALCENIGRAVRGSDGALFRRRRVLG